MIFVIDDDELMSRCIVRACSGHEVRRFSNAIDAMRVFDEGIPNLIFLDILLDGPDGFTLINELASYPDTAKIPIVIVSSLDLSDRDLSSYGVVGILSKDSMVPEELLAYANEYD